MENEGNAGTTGSSRWNPTKEQINMLETLYKQGIRTPSADQIQQITGRLRAYGHIEGKNVFYWFQNHKARQRQKQKQESIAYFNRLFHKTSRFFYPSSNSNVACGGPCYVHQGDGGVHAQPHHKVLHPGGYGYGTNNYIDQKKPDMTTRMYGSARFDRFTLHHHHNFAHQDEGVFVNFHHDSVDGDFTSRKTLPLFPLQPSDALYGKSDVNMGNSNFSSPSGSPVPAAWIGGCDGGQQQRQQPFFDFFSSSNGSCKK